MTTTGSATTCTSLAFSIAKCRYYSSLLACVICDKGFFLSSPTKCDPVTPPTGLPNCDVAATATTCKYCDNPFVVNASGACTNSVTDFTNKYNAAGKCTAYSASGCIACDSTALLDTTTNTCVPITSPIPNCLQYASQTTCLYCTKPYVLNDQKCVFKAIPNCAIYTPTGDCLYCISGYYSADSGKTCTSTSPGVANCKYLLSSTTCAICNSGFMSTSARTACVALGNVPNCYNFDSNNNCSLCDKSTGTAPFYYLTGTTPPTCASTSATATNPSPDCLFLKVKNNTNNIICIYCMMTAYFKSANDSCTKFPTGSTVVVQNCATYNTATTCQFCTAAYYL